jgi:hypothetical protein
LLIIYNQNAILQIISLESKEGQFLTKGVTIYKGTTGEGTTGEGTTGIGSFGYNSGLTSNKDYTVRCNIKNNTSTPILEKIDYFESNNQNASATKEIDYNNLENIIPGFKFINNPCNPCTNLKDYSCPFSLNIKEKNIYNNTTNNDTNTSNTSTISQIYRYLWNL